MPTLEMTTPNVFECNYTTTVILGLSYSKRKAVKFSLFIFWDEHQLGTHYRASQRTSLFKAQDHELIVRIHPLNLCLRDETLCNEVKKGGGT